MSIVLVGSTSGSCTLQEQAVAGNTVLTLPTTSGTLITTGSSGQSIPKAALPTGSVLQVIQATFTGTQQIATGGSFANWADITNLSVNITPISSTSKVLLLAQITYGMGSDRMGFFRFTGGNTASYLANTAGSRTRTSAFFITPSNAGVGGTIVMNYLDSPATTSQITYKVQGAPNFSSTDLFINLNPMNDGDLAYVGRGASSLIAMEIAA